VHRRVDVERQGRRHLRHAWTGRGR
jgi:hypothetical protein